jgi:hypothetical protein
MFNRTYHIRARRAAIGKLIAQGILRSDPDDPRFYRPPAQVSPVATTVAKDCRKIGKVEGLQLAFDFEGIRGRDRSSGRNDSGDPLEETDDEMFNRLFPE